MGLLDKVLRILKCCRIFSWKKAVGQKGVNNHQAFAALFFGLKDFFRGWWDGLFLKIDYVIWWCFWLCGFRWMHGSFRVVNVGRFSPQSYDASRVQMERPKPPARIFLRYTTWCQWIFDFFDANFHARILWITVHHFDK